MPRYRFPHPRSPEIFRTTTLALLAATVACGGGGGGNNTPTNPGGGGTTNTTVTSISVIGSAATVNVGASLALTATARNSAGTAVPATFAWTSSATNIATVGATTGVVTGVAVGTATITATAAGISGTQVISVTTPANPGPPPNAVTVNMPGTVFDPSNFRLAVGGTVTYVFTAVAHDVNFSGGAGAPAMIPITTNATITRTFSTAGTFNMVCTLHAGMNGVITVVAP
jgi:plastocyanin